LEISDGREVGDAVVDGAVAEAVGDSADAAGASVKIGTLITASDSQRDTNGDRPVPVSREM
jgi:hypothetical protein